MQGKGEFSMYEKQFLKTMIETIKYDDEISNKVFFSIEMVVIC